MTIAVVKIRWWSFEIFNLLKPIAHAHISQNCPQEFKYFACMAVHDDYSFVVKEGKTATELTTELKRRAPKLHFDFGTGDVDEYHCYQHSHPTDSCYKGLSGPSHRSTAVLYLVSS